MSTDVSLPELPDSQDRVFIVGRYGDNEMAEAGGNYYTENQMREYARQAVLDGMGARYDAAAKLLVAWGYLWDGTRWNPPTGLDTAGMAIYDSRGRGYNEDQIAMIMAALEPPGRE